MQQRKLSSFSAPIVALALAGAMVVYAAWPKDYELAPVPGAIDPQVTQRNIHTTICTRGYAHSVRPPLEDTEEIKRALVPKGDYLSNYELDHLIPLELGGAPLSPRNLWVQPIAEARVKDRLEDKLHELVCSDAMPLNQAQECISSNWIRCYQRVFGRAP